MTNARDFLMEVIEWPGDHDRGCAALCWCFPNPDQPDPAKKRHKLWSSRCFRDPDSMVSFAGFLMSKPNNKDIYFCTALLNERGEPTKSGRAYKAKRLASNVLSRKCLCADIDIKPTGYPTMQAARAALAAAILSTNLPSPDIYVASGGGLHVYWNLDEAIPLERWQPYADGVAATLLKAGLRFDSQCTVDPVRILRLPGTYNYKFNPPVEVRVL